MLNIELPDNLLQQIEAAGLTGSAVDEFVRQAVKEKLAAAERRKRFFDLSDQMRAAMHEQGLTEEQVLAEFEKRRRSDIGQSADGFDAVCDDAAIPAAGTHLTRDQLHQRD